MDYEKKYNEALKWMRELYPGLHGATKEDAEHYFPELRESEDERTRKELVQFLTDVKNISEDGRHSWQVRKEDAEMCTRFLAYLEKQKEQKSLNINAASEWLRKNISHYMNSEYNEFHKCVEYDGRIDKERLINDFEKAMQKEQKPISFSEPYNSDDYEAVMEGNATSLKRKEQKPVECVTDAEMKKGLDELTKFKHFASALSDMYNIIPSHSSLRPKDIDWNNFCAGLLTYLKRVQPAEWSEEDEQMRDNIISVLQKDVTYTPPTRPNSCNGSGNAFYTHQTEIDWLKSLHPSWKPSEEQMGALRRTVNKLANTDVADSVRLSIMYDNLKKL